MPMPTATPTAKKTKKMNMTDQLEGPPGKQSAPAEEDDNGEDEAPDTYGALPAMHEPHPKRKPRQNEIHNSSPADPALRAGVPADPTRLTPPQPPDPVLCQGASDLSTRGRRRKQPGKVD